MSDLSNLECLVCGAQLERVRYFPRQLLTADDMRVEQDYFRQKVRRHNRYLHGWGVVCGCTVEAAPSPEHHWQVRVCPGFAVGPQGDDILIDDCILFDLKHGMPQPQPCAVRWPCPPEGEMPAGRERDRLYLAVRYAECVTRPVRVHPAGCGCDETQCEYSRVRDSFELKVLWELPKSHKQAREADDAWCAKLKEREERREPILPVPPCPPCIDNPWVVLATIRLPQNATTDIAQDDISEIDRRALWSTMAIQAALDCLT